jgi:hypothetical protein
MTSNKYLWKQKGSETKNNLSQKKLVRLFTKVAAVACLEGATNPMGLMGQMNSMGLIQSIQRMALTLKINLETMEVSFRTCSFIT